MLVYNYDFNGVFVSATEADESPLERGVFLVPANATKTEPPVEMFGKVRVFHKGQWSNVDVSEHGKPYLPHDEPKTPDQIKAALTNAVQRHLDGTAQAFGYDGILSAVSYADESTVPTFQEDGMKFRAWRSLVWATCYEIMQSVERLERDIPTMEQLISELPLLDVDTPVWVAPAVLDVDENGNPIVPTVPVDINPVWDEVNGVWVTPAAPEPVVTPVVESAPAKSNKFVDITKMIWNSLSKSWVEPPPVVEFEPAVLVDIESPTEPVQETV